MRRTLVALTVAVCAAAASAQAAGALVYKLSFVQFLKGSAPSWDYLTVDSGRSLLFLGRRAAGVTVYDTRAHAVVGSVENSAGANDATLVPEFGRGYTTNGDGSTTVFDLATFKAIARIKIGEDADAAFYDPATRQLAFTLGDAHSLLFMDAKSATITGKLELPGHELEGVAPDGKGALFVVERDIAKVAKVDSAGHALISELPLPNCELPTGVALDRERKRLFLGCKGDHPVLTVVDTETGKVVAQPEIGRGNDGVVYDPATRRVYTSNGVDGNIVIFDQKSADSYVLAQAVTTRPIARTMAFDPTTLKIYTMTAEGYVDPAKKVNRRAGAFYPNTYFDDTMTLLEYSPIKITGKGPADDE